MIALFDTCRLTMCPDSTISPIATIALARPTDQLASEGVSMDSDCLLLNDLQSEQTCPHHEELGDLH